MRESPHTRTESVAAASAGKFVLQPREGTVPPAAERPMSGTANSYQSLSQPKCRRSAVSLGGSDLGRKPKTCLGSGIACSLAITSTVVSCSSRCSPAGHRRTSCRRTYMA